MKQYIAVFILFFSFNVFAQQTSSTVHYDNLNVSINSIKNANCTVKEEEENPGVYTLDYVEKNKVFQMLLTLYPINPANFKTESLKDALTKKGNTMLGTAEEKELIINTITSNSQASGYYYALTDKKPKEGEYKYVIQGFIKYNHLVGYFTFLYNKKDTIKLFNDLDIQKFVKDSPALTKTKYFEKIKLNEKEITKYKLQYIQHFYSQQQVIFYNSTDLYNSILPKLAEKYTQSVCIDDVEGTIFYYYFKDKIDSSMSGFITGLFYGEEGVPSKDNPETVIIKDNYVIVFSYPYKNKLQNELMTIINNKLK